MEDVDIDLVIRASSGDHDAFAAIATSIASRLHGTAYAILREPTLAEDAAQSAMVNVWRDLPRLRDPAKFEIDFPFLLAMIDKSFISRRNTIVVPGGKMLLAMELILMPILKNMIVASAAGSRLVA